MTGSLIRDLLLDVRNDVKGETRNISIIANTVLSAFTDDPINLAVVSPSSEGKTYLVVKTLSRFPQKYIWMYRKVSPKTFTRERGVLAIRRIVDNREVFDTRIQNAFTGERTTVSAYLRFLKEAVSNKKDDPRIVPEEAEEALFALEEDLHTLIDFHDKVLVFLDRPDPALWNELLSVLSHDKEYIITSFVEGEGFKRNRRVVFWGWPAVIFCTSKEEDFNWRDLETRFQIIEPVMNERKYRQAVEYAFNMEYAVAKQGNDDTELSHRLEQLILWMIDHRPRVVYPFPPERVPQAITQGRIASGDLMRKLPRIGRHIAMNALFHKDDRVILSDGKQDAVIIAYQDIMSLAYLFDDVQLGASFAGLGPASYELLLKVMMPLFSQKGENPEDLEGSYVKQSEIKRAYAEYLNRFRYGSVSFSPATFTRRMKELEARGFIKRVQDEEDKRGLRIIPTWSEVPESFSLISRLRNLSLRVEGGKLVSPWTSEDFSYLDYLETLNFTPYLEHRKLVSHDPEIIQNGKTLVLEIPNFTRFLMRASGYNTILAGFDETILAQNEGSVSSSENYNSPDTLKD
ncbi:MAG: MarR family transcriptional regulator [Thermoplasmata archaeon]